MIKNIIKFIICVVVLLFFFLFLCGVLCTFLPDIVTIPVAVLLAYILYNLPGKIFKSKKESETDD